MGRRGALVAVLALVGACGTLTANETPGGTDAGGGSITDAAVAETGPTDATSAPACGWTPFDDGFDGPDAWETDHAYYGPQSHLVVEPATNFALSAPRSLVTTITPDSDTRAYSYQIHPQGTGTGCLELRFALHVDRTPRTAGGDEATPVSIATVEFTDGSYLAILLQFANTLELQEATAADGGALQYSLSAATPDIAPKFSTIVLRVEGGSATLSVDGRPTTKALATTHGAVDVVRVGCRYAAADVTATYAIDDVSIR